MLTIKRLGDTPGNRSGFTVAIQTQQRQSIGLKKNGIVACFGQRCKVVLNPCPVLRHHRPTTAGLYQRAQAKEYTTALWHPPYLNLPRALRGGLTFGVNSYRWLITLDAKSVLNIGV